MRVVGLFAGIGGFEVGLENAGHETILLSELDEQAKTILDREFGSPVVGDIRRLRRLPRGTEIVAAGFPCTDLSQAGRTAGIRGEQSGLIDVVFELIEHGPRVPWVVLENVPNILRLHGGHGIRHITRRLERLGYSWAYRVVDTRAFGLPQRRQRVFVVASRERDPSCVLFASDEEPTWPADREFDRAAFGYGFYWTEGNRGVGWAREAVPTLKGGSGIGIPSAPAVWLPQRAPARAFVVPGIEDAERLQGFEPGWTRGAVDDVRGDRRRWRLVGNAVAVPVAEWIGKGLKNRALYESRPQRPFQRGKWPIAARGGPGIEPVAVDVTTWPVSELRKPLRGFLQSATPLSVGAAAGFLDRLQRSTLSVGPTEFRVALAQYCTDHGCPRIARAASAPRDAESASRLAV
ncbi:DNA cytosine methyltransferase [Sandaracinus amylolyticus]|uniref:DNA cytosine methyltransferase n=1 Tax=Sandaracinus amylolyticus TaxID=927083 RepID=UPI001F2D6763|nr:DNA (cytosine-5-)-methyltransferase [Sandaracinus amylolyticus]UJR83671.1 Hypothetical protein I5071_57400 [Sandaracinus amylolyticus]